MMSKEVMHGGKSVTVSTPISNRAGTLQARGGSFAGGHGVSVAGAVRTAALEVGAQAAAPTAAAEVEALVVVPTEAAEAPVPPVQAAAVPRAVGVVIARCKNRLQMESCL